MTRNIACIALIAVAASFAVGDHQDKDKPAPAKHAQFDKLKALAGEWYSLDKDGKPTTQLVSVFKVTAAGSAVHETIFPGTPHEMVSVYHLDGKDLVLTHYCAAKNQPRMKAEADGPANKLSFKFAGGANIDPAKDFHMHEGAITIVNDYTIEWTWYGWAKGKPVDDHKVSMKLARKK
jgi:hypothetical protein